MKRSVFARLAPIALSAVASLGIYACMDATGPSREPIGRHVAVTLNPVFTGSVAASIVQFEKVHIIIKRLDGTIALDTLIDFPAGVDQIAVSLDVPLSPTAPFSGEDFTADLEMLDHSGAVVFRGGPISMHAGVGQTPAPVDIPTTYTGPGASAVKVTVNPAQTTGVPGGVVDIVGTAFDASNNPIPNTPIQWTSLTPNIITVPDPTVGHGIVALTRGTGTIRATLVTGQTADAQITVNPVPSTLSLASGSGQTGTPGSPLAQPLVVKAMATDGLVVGGVSVTFAVQSGGGSVSPATVVTGADGLASATYTGGNTAGAATITATASGLSGSPVSFSETISAGAATQISVNAGNNQTAIAGAAVSTAPSVIVKDANNNVKAGVTVTFAAASGGGSVTGATATTNAQGIATVGSWILGTAAGANTLTATSAGLTGSPVTFSATGIAGPAATIAANAGNNQSATTGNFVTINPSVIVKDVNGNPVNNVAVTFAVATGGGTITGAAQTTGTNGIATVGSWAMGPNAGPNTVTATSAGLTGSPVTFTANSTPAGTISINGGNNQSANGGTAVSVPPSVKVLDPNNQPVPNVSVTFFVASGGGTVTGSNATTNASGIATVGSWTLGGIAGANTLQASANVNGSPVTFTATGTVGPAATISISSGNNQSAAVATAVATAPTVIVKDLGGNPVSGASVAFTVASGGGSATGLVATTNASGLASVGSWTLGNTVGTNTLTATSGTLTGSPVTFTATGTPGTATQMALNAGNNQSATVGTPVAVPPSVVVMDAFGNAKPGVTVTFAVASGGGSVTGASATTNASGIATVGSWTVGPAVGANNNTLTATSGTLTGSPVTFTASGIVGAPTQIAVNAGNNQTAVAGAAVATAPSVIVRDASNNPVAGVNVTFAVASGGGSLTGGAATTNASGIATVGSWTLGTGAGANTLTATSGTLAGSPVTFTATGTAGPATQIAINAGNNQTATVSSAVAVNPSAIVKDANNNPVSGVSVTFAVATGGGSITGAAATTNASGIATVGSWTLGAAAGSNTLTATSGTLTGSPLTFTATGQPGAGTITVNAGNAQTATAGTAVAVAPSVIIKDAGNNPIVGATVTFAVASGGGAITGASATTNASGIATVGSWTLGNTAGSNTLTATSAGIIGSPLTFTATGVAGPATQIAINAGNNQTTAPGAAVGTPPSVIVKDVNNNPVAGVSVTFAVATGGGSATGTAATTNASGIAAVGSWTLGASPGPNTLTATSGTLTGSPITFSATAQAGAPTQIAINAGNNQTANAGSAVTTAPSVIVKDASNNPVVGVSVTFAVATGGGSITGGAATTNASGIATVGSWTLGTAAGTNTLTATSGTLAGSPITFTATGVAGPATQIAVSAGNNQSAGTSSTLPINPSVIVRDANNNPVSGVNVTFAVASGGGSATGTAATTNASGIATVGSWTLGPAAGANTLTATSGTLAGSPVTFTATGTSSQIVLNVSASPTATTNSGLDVVIPLNVDMSNRGTNDLASLQLDFNWDPTKFSLKSQAAGNWVDSSGNPATVTVNNAQVASGKISLNAFTTNATLTSFTLRTITLTALTTASTITTPVTATIIAAGQENASPAPVVARNLTVTVNP